MDTSILELTKTIMAALGGAGIVIFGLAAWLGRVWDKRISQALKFTSEIDLDLRKRRIGVYGALWQSTSLLPKWPRAEDVTYEQLRTLGQNLRLWYFEQGGIYLSRTTHDKGYGPLQSAIVEVVADGANGPLSPDDYETVRQKCSALRSMLAADLQSRRDSPV